MTNLFKKLVFTDKAIDDLTVAVQAGKSITVERAVLSGWTPPDDDQVYTPYKNSSGALDVAAVKANINKYFDKTEALKNTAPAWVEGILKPKTVKKENKNTLNFTLDFENTDFDHDVAAKYYGYTSWAELLDNMSEFNIDAQSVALLAQDDTGLEYVFAFAKIESDDSLKYPAALTTELTHKLHIDLFINITQSDNIIIKYIPEGLVEYSEFAQHVEQAATIYAKKVDVYTKTESDGRFARSATINGGAKVTPNSSGNLDLTVDLNNYATKDDVNKKANSSDVYTKTESDGRFVRGASVNGGSTVTPNSDGIVDLNVPEPDLSDYYTKTEVDDNFHKNIILVDSTAKRDEYGLKTLDTAQAGEYYLNLVHSSTPQWIKDCPIKLRIIKIIKIATGTNVVKRCIGYGYENNNDSAQGYQLAGVALLITEPNASSTEWVVNYADTANNTRLIYTGSGYEKWGLESPVTAQGGIYVFSSDTPTTMTNKWLYPSDNKTFTNIRMIEVNKGQEHILVKAYETWGETGTIYYGCYFGTITADTKLTWYKQSLTKV